jgi:two-component system cell cycle sensor histidine kinase/response regulator CckA
VVWKQTLGARPVEGAAQRVNVSRLPPESDSAVLASILEHAPVSVIAFDDEGRILLWNAGAERLLGWSATEVLGHVAPFPRGEPATTTQPHDVERVTRSGAVAHLSVTRERIATRGAPAMTIEIGRDLANRKRLEEHVVQGVKLEAVARLAGGIAHDFNNVLAAIRCSCELISGSLPPGDARAGDVRAIESSSARAAELTRQLLAFTRQQVLVPQVLDLNEVARAAEQMLLGIKGSAIELEYELAANPVHVRADASQLQQALIHLVVNAREATPGGGRVTVSTGRDSLDHDPTGGGVPIVRGTYGWLTVRDTGRGIASEVHGRIFEPFYTTKERGTGTGLGLSAVYGIMKQSGGYTFVRSAVDEGASFTIYLPIVEAPLEETLTARPRRAPAGSAATILLVEDEVALRGLVKRILERSGYVVIEAEHGAQALERCASHDGEIDLVVSDIVMPTMGGLEMARRMRALRPESRFLFVSGFTDDEVIREEILAPRSSYLQKPFSPAALVAKVGEMLRDAAAAAQADAS